jgi:hypothetical protein
MKQARWLVAVAALALAFNTVGCGGAKPEPTKSSDAAQALSGKDQIRERLRMISDTGSGGSAVSGMRAGLEQLKATEGPLAEDLLKDMEELQQLQGPSQIKAKANVMLDKLSK